MEKTNETPDGRRPGEVAPPRLTRAQDGRMLAGVCAGIGRHTGLDPNLIRLGVILLSLFGGSGIWVYLAAALIIPDEIDPAGSRRRIVKVTLITVGATIIVAMLAFPLLGVFMAGLHRFGINGAPDPSFFVQRFFFVSPGWIIALVLIVAGVALFRSDGRRQVLPTEGGSGTEPGGGAPIAATAWGRTTAKPERPSSALTPLTLSLALVVVGVMTALSNGGTWNLEVGQIAAAALVVVGAGLLVGAFRGRGRLLVLAGVALVPVVLAASLIHMPPRGRIGQDFRSYTTAKAFPESYDLLLGDANLDLSRTQGDFGARELYIRVGAGALNVYLPFGVDVTVEGRIGLGSATIGRHSMDGRGIVLDSHLEGQPGEGSLELHIDAGIADVVVHRVTAAEARPKDTQQGRGPRTEGSARHDRKDR